MIQSPPNESPHEAAGNSGLAPLRVADLVINPGTQQVFRGEQEITLPKLSFDFLLALVRAAPNVVSHDELLEQVWPGLVVSPETLTQRAKLLRAALNDDVRSPRYVGLVRGRGYRLLAPVGPEEASVAAPSAVPPGAPQPPVAVPAPARPRRAWLPWAGAALVLLLVAGALLRRDPPAPAPVPAPAARQAASIAVLPFDALSPEAREYDYFATGMHDDLLTHLAQIDGLRVISRGSMLTYRVGQKTSREIAAELDVTHVLEGSVQQVGGRVRVNVQLIDGKDDDHVWAKTYDRVFSASQVLDIQDDIARAVAAALELALSPRYAAGGAGTANDEAYRLYLTGNGYRRRAYEDAQADYRTLFLAAEDHYRRAAALDPNFALAHAALARVLTEIFWQQVRPGAEDGIEEARQAAETALQLAPGLPEAHLGLAYYHYYGRRDWTAALDEIARAEEGMPASADILATKMYLLRRVGRLDEFVDTAGRGWELAPRDMAFATLYAEGLLKQRRLDEAEQVYRRMARAVPGNGKSAFGLATVEYLRTGDVGVLAAAAVAVAAEYPESAWRLTWVAGDFDASRRVLDGTTEAESGDWLPLLLKRGLTEQRAGRTELAAAQIEGAVSQLQANLRQADAAFPERQLRSLAQALAALGRKQEAIEAGQAAVERLTAGDDALMEPLYLRDLAFVYASVGEPEQALDALERSLSLPFAPLPWTWQHDPRLEGLRGEPRFQRLVERYGVPTDTARRPVATGDRSSP